MSAGYLDDQMMVRHLFVAGFSHARVPIRLREKYRLTPEGQRRLLIEARTCAPVRELAVLNTCNRFELYVVSTRSDWSPEEQVGHILRMIWPDMDRADFDELVRAAYWHEGADCARHLYRTSASLDSMVVGEPEVNGQVKAAYQAAHELGATGPVLNRLFQNAFSAAKRVRTQTNIARGCISIGTVAVRTGLDAVAAPSGVLLLGAGQMARTIARHLRNVHHGPLYVANRTREHAEALATEVSGVAVALGEIRSLLPTVDLVLAAAGAPEFLVNAVDLEACRGRPLTLVDVCLPRSIDPAARCCAGVRLLDLDDLQHRIAEGEHRRRSDLQRAEDLVVECVGADWPRLLFTLGQGECPAMRSRESRRVSEASR